MVSGRAVAAFLVCLLAWQTGWAAVSARFDRDTIRINETVRLQIQSDDVSNGGEPDLSGLMEHFRILGQSSGQNISIVNGQQSATRTWTLELEPKSVGSFSIDPIAVGGQRTELLRISILPEGPATPGTSDVFIEVEVDRDTVYVQQQVVFTARIFVGVPAVDATVSDPAPQDAVVRRLGGDRNYNVKRGGRDYRVFERRYAVFPQSSGSLDIPPLRFQGVVDETGLGGRGFGSLFNRGKRIRARSQGVTVAVNPPVDLQPGETWLPAQQLQIHDLSEPVDQYRVGEPVTLKLQLQALGLTAEQLPEIKLPTSDGVRLYPDQAEKETHDDEENVIGIQLNRIAVIPEKSGELVIPGIEVNWWNVRTDSRETAALPARTISVAPAANTPAPEVEDTGPESTATEDPVMPAVTPGPSTESGGKWKWLAIGSLGLWIVTVLGFACRFRSTGSDRRKPPTDPRLDEKAAVRALKTACRSDDAVAARAHLLEWGRQRHQREVALDELGRLTGDAALNREIGYLNRHLYAPDGGIGAWSGDALWAAFEGALQSLGHNGKSAHTALEALYPG